MKINFLKFYLYLKGGKKKLLSKIKENKKKIISNVVLLIVGLIGAIDILKLAKANYLTIWNFNKDILIMLMPFIIISLIIKLVFFDNKNWGVFLTSISVIIAILFFLFQNTFKKIETENQIQAKINSIKIINTHNCILSEKIIKDMDNRGSENYTLNYYTVDTYNQNFDLIFNKYGQEKVLKYLKIVNNMQSSNTLINTVQNLVNEKNIIEGAKLLTEISALDRDKINNINNTISERNQNIVSIAYTINELICQQNL